MKTKTKEEILKTYCADYQDGRSYSELDVLDAMNEYATQQTEAKDREIAELKKDLNEANKLLFEAEKRISTIRPSDEALKRLITNYLNKAV